jgi:hypothetical protein
LSYVGRLTNYLKAAFASRFLFNRSGAEVRAVETAGDVRRHTSERAKRWQARLQGRRCIAMPTNDSRRPSGAEQRKLVRDHVRKMLAKLAAFQQNKPAQRPSDDGLRTEVVQTNRKKDGT